MKKLLQFTLLAFVLFACGANNTEEAKEAKDMADFADEKDFKEAHETPAEIDFSGKGQKISFATTDGKEALAYLVPATEKREDNKYLFVIHEWYGLNDFIKRESERLAEAMPDVSVIALDLYDGKVASTREKASEYMQAVQNERAQAIIAGAMGQVGSGAKIATIGWCFGGGWSLRSNLKAAGRIRYEARRRWCSTLRHADRPVVFGASDCGQASTPADRWRPRCIVRPRT